MIRIEKSGDKKFSVYMPILAYRELVVKGVENGSEALCIAKLYQNMPVYGGQYDGQIEDFGIHVGPYEGNQVEQIG